MTAQVPVWIWILVAVVVLLVVISLARRRGGRDERARGGDLADGDARVRPNRNLNLAPLTAGARARYAEEWSTAQARFVDDPRTSLATAEHILISAMRDRGYPESSAEQLDADLGAAYPRLVGRYRSAQEIVARQNASTEDLRQALVHYRSVLDEMLGRSAIPRD
ncbi:MAG: hypothetical protein ABR591_03770 [Candidatus Velthaea sp.]